MFVYQSHLHLSIFKYLVHTTRMSYSEFYRSSLQQFCRERGLSPGGSVADLVARLEADDDIRFQIEYDRWPIAILNQHLKLHDLKVSGNKGEKVQRMLDFDTATDDGEDEGEHRDSEDASSDDGQDLDDEIGDENTAVSAAITMQKGQHFRNVLGTSKDRVSRKAREIIQRLGRLNCVFCRRTRIRIGLNHVVSVDEDAEESTNYLLAPSCARCNKSSSVLRLHSTAKFVRPGNCKTISKQTVYVMLHE